MNKKDLRERYKLLRQSLNESLIADYSIQIANQLLKIPVWDKIYFHLFLSIEEKKEVQTSFILNLLYGKDKEVVISKSNFEDGTMINYLLTENTRIKKNSYNIPEPVDGIQVPDSKIDVVFVPLLAFDKNGNRVGYGKGFYDKFLQSCRAETIKIGLSFFTAEDNIDDVGQHDIQLDYCVTPETIYNFP